MLPKNSGHLLFNAVRETLETMAFAEVVPCSIKVGGEECSVEDHHATLEPPAEAPVTGGWGDATDEPMDAEPVDTWGLAVPAMSNTEQPPEGDNWGAVAGLPPSVESDGDSWGDPELPVENEEDWGHRDHVTLPEADPWGDAAALDSTVDGDSANPREADFDDMVANQEDWCWANMKVNSPDIQSVWLVISRGLANALAQNMYAGEEFHLDNPLIRDLIAELTNVFGGRLMLLLEEMGGKFTLTVPVIGFGMPTIPESPGLDTVHCKVVVDGEYPVITALCYVPAK